QGPGQHEIDFRYDDALKAADNFLTFKSVVKNIAARNGLHASFLPKPMLNASGSGLHINMSIYKDNKNIFNLSNELNKGPSASFVEGVLSRIEDICLFANPITNSYERMGEKSAPKYISWSEGNRSQLIRIPSAKGSLKRMELRSPDPVCSPYLTFALLIHAGMDGINHKLDLRKAVKFNLYAAPSEKLKKYKQLPENLGDALEFAKKSDFIKEVIPADTLKRYILKKEKEWKDVICVEDKYRYEIDNYFYKY
ncbi:MAG: type I glutamate--ammonia ligase, partial [Bacillota bacterium]